MSQVSAFKKAQNGFRQTLKWLCDFFNPFCFLFSRICLSTTRLLLVPIVFLQQYYSHYHSIPGLLLLCHRNILNTKDLMEIARFINSTNLCQRKLINMKSTVGVSTQIKIKMGETLSIIKDTFKIHSCKEKLKPCSAKVYVCFSAWPRYNTKICGRWLMASCFAALHNLRAFHTFLFCIFCGCRVMPSCCHHSAKDRKFGSLNTWPSLKV